MKKVYVFGSLNMDLVISAPHEVRRGETVSGSGFMTNSGGKGANQAVACGKLGAQTVMGGAVGADDFGNRLLESVQNSSVDISRIAKLPDVSTGVAVITVIDGDNRIVLDAGANGAVSAHQVDILLEDAARGDLFLTQLENPIAIIGYALQKAKEKGMMTILNPAPITKDIIPFLQYVDIVIPNENEFFDLTETDSLKDGAAFLMKQGVSHIIVTLGEKGYAYLYGNPDEYNPICHYGEAVLCQAIDTTAAGDTFCGALASRLALEESMPKALDFANRAAAITVTRRGAQKAIPWLNELK